MKVLRDEEGRWVRLDNRVNTNNPFHKMWTGVILTPKTIDYTQRWIKLRLGKDARLYMERIEEKNNCYLRVDFDDGIYQAEIRAINKLRKKNPGAAVKRVTELFTKVA